MEIIKFKDFINEKRNYIAKKGQKEWELMKLGFMPLTPSILKDFEIFIPKAYHVTGLFSIEKVQKLQNKKIDLATFTKGSTGISKGAIEDADVIFELEGYSSFSAEQDFESVLDRNGHRWLQPLKDKDYVVNNKFTVPMKTAIVKKYGLNDRYEIESLVSKFDGKQKAEFIKFYIDESKKIITKTLLQEIKDSISKNYVMSGFDNNEILLHNYRIKKLYIIGDPEDDEEIWDRIQELADINVDGYMSAKEIEILGR